MTKPIKNISEILKIFEDLASKILEKSRNSEVFYCLNPGNLGDSLIREGTEHFFSEFGIQKKNILYENETIYLLDEKNNKDKKIDPSSLKISTLVYAGGGGWCNVWTGGRKNVEQLSQFFSHTIILPSTYENPVELENATIYARDLYESMQNAKDALFCHDMAFYLLFSMPYAIHKTRSLNTAFCFRKDKESNIKEHWKIPLSNVDLSWKGNYLDSPLPMLEYVAEHKAVHTDRLHVAVACCLTGTKFYLYPGAYFKNKAIFKTTMDPYFDLGTWRDDLPLSVKISNSLERKVKALLGSRLN